MVTISRLQGSVLELPLEDLHIDQAYQRGISKGHVRDIADNFDEKVLGILVVNRRVDGQYCVIDGQHRLEALRRLGVLSAKCEVFYNLTTAEEASVFKTRNANQKRSTGVDNFKAALVAEEIDALEIERILNGIGVAIGPNRTTGSTRAIAALYNLYYSGYLREVIDIVAEAFSDKPTIAFTGRILFAVTTFISVWPEFNRGFLVDALRKIDLGYLYGISHGVSSHHNKANAPGARAIFTEYNKRRTSNALEDRPIRLVQRNYQG